MAYISQALATSLTACRTRRNHMQALRAHVNGKPLYWSRAKAFSWFWHPCHPDDIEELLEMTGSRDFPYEPSLMAGDQ